MGVLPQSVDKSAQDGHNSTMRKVQFWVLMVVSLGVCALYGYEIYLGHLMFQQQKMLVQAEQFAGTGASYENSWKQLAAHIYQAGASDAALRDVLKRNQIEVQPRNSAPVAAPAASVPANTAKPGMTDNPSPQTN
jgi:hypothetical protein